MEEGESVWLIPILECILHLNAASCGRLATDPSQHVCVCDIFSCNNISLHNVGIIPIPLLMCTISVWHTSMASMNNDAVNVCISIGWFNLANISTSDIGFKLRIGHSLILGCSEGPHFLLYRPLLLESIYYQFLPKFWILICCRIFFLMIIFLCDYTAVMCDCQVVANAVAAISEIMETSASASQLVDVNSQIINKLLTALNECTEWVLVCLMHVADIAVCHCVTCEL